MEQITTKESALWQKIFNYARGSQTEKEFLLSVKDEFSISEFSETKEPVNRLFYVVADNSEETWEQITNGLDTYERAEKYRDSDFCKKRWPNAFIVSPVYFSPVPVSEVGQITDEKIKLIFDTFLSDCDNGVPDEEAYTNAIYNFKSCLPVPNTKTETKL